VTWRALPIGDRATVHRVPVGHAGPGGSRGGPAGPSAGSVGVRVVVRIDPLGIVAVGEMGWTLLAADLHHLDVELHRAVGPTATR